MKRAFWIILLIAAIYGEMALLTLGKNFAGSPLSPMLWLICGIACAVAGFFLTAFKNAEQEAPKSLNRKENGLISRFSETFSWLNPRLRDAVIVWVVYVGGAVYAAVCLSAIFAKYPIDPGSSDIVPSMELYVRRFLSGERVYETLVFPNHKVDPTYFPLMWMPYIIPEILNIDYRWAPYGIFLIVLFFYYRYLATDQIHWAEKLLKAIIPFFILKSCFRFGDAMFGYAVELVPVAFYLFLSGSIFHKSRWVTGLGVLVCLLSRYAFTFWLPVYLLILLMTEGWKSVFRIGIVSGAGILLLYVLPFLMRDPEIFTRGLAYYEKTAEGQWQLQGWQSPGEKPYHLTHGLSFSEWFYDHTAGDFRQKLQHARKWHIVACMTTAILIFIIFLIFLFYKNKSLNINGFSLVALKLYLAVFYGFWYVPFPYLYLLPLFISIPILYRSKIFRTFVIQG